MKSVIDVPRTSGEGRLQFLAEELARVEKTALHTGGVRTPMTRLTFRDGSTEWVHPDVYQWLTDAMGFEGKLEYMAQPLEPPETYTGPEYAMYKADADLPRDSARRRMP